VFSILAEKDHGPIRSVVAQALKEFEIERGLETVRSRLAVLKPAYDVNRYGVSVMTNGAELVEALRENLVQVRMLAGYDGCAPFVADLRALEEAIIVAYEKIDLFVSLETSLSAGK
jgi:hypothetical protein